MYTVYLIGISAAYAHECLGFDVDWLITFFLRIRIIFVIYFESTSLRIIRVIFTYHSYLDDKQKLSFYIKYDNN